MASAGALSPGKQVCEVEGMLSSAHEDYVRKLHNERITKKKKYISYFSGDHHKRAAAI